MNYKNYVFLLILTLLGCKTTKPLRPSVNISPHDVITSPLEIKVNSMGVWYASEGELGLVKLYDSEGQELTWGIMSATEEWMRPGPVMFQTTLKFNPGDSKTGVLVIHNDPGNGSGDEAGEEISFEIPVRFKP